MLTKILILKNKIFKNEKENISKDCVKAVETFIKEINSKNSSLNYHIDNNLNTNKMITISNKEINGYTKLFDVLHNCNLKQVKINNNETILTKLNKTFSNLEFNSKIHCSDYDCITLPEILIIRKNGKKKNDTYIY